MRMEFRKYWSIDTFSVPLTVSKLKVYDKKNCTMVFMININSNMYVEMILGVFEIF